MAALITTGALVVTSIPAQGVTQPPPAIEVAVGPAIKLTASPTPKPAPAKAKPKPKATKKARPKPRQTKRASRSAPRKGAALDLRRRDFWMCVHSHEGLWTSSGGTYEGGLQFLHSTWVRAGGRAFAEHAYQATPNEQITVANWYSKGGAWLTPWPPAARCVGKFGMTFP